MPDQGQIDIHTDFDTGMISIGVREPLALDTRKAEISVLDFLDLAARIQMQYVAEARKIAQHMAAQAAQQALKHGVVRTS